MHLNFAWLTIFVDYTEVSQIAAFGIVFINISF